MGGGLTSAPGGAFVGPSAPRSPEPPPWGFSALALSGGVPEASPDGGT
jgi:hypothetical protein